MPGIDGHLEDDVVRVGGDARQRFFDSRGYGYPLEGNEIALDPVEAAHLLFRGDLDAVDGADFRGFVTGREGDFAVRFLVYADLRSRGFYLSPAREPWVASQPPADFVVFPRGKGPRDDAVEYAVRVVGERTPVPASSLDPGVLAVVDEESEITYLSVDAPDLTGSTTTSLPTGVDAEVLDDRVVAWNPPAALYERAFYGHPLAGREFDGRALQLSLVEAAYLAGADVLDLDPVAVRERGRAVEGERFDRRLAVYGHLRDAGVVPKTGFKFGADFRTYADVTTVDDLGHSELLVRVLPGDHVFEPRDLALDVRLAHGVRKQIVYAFVATDGTSAEPIAWRSLERLTP